MKKRNYTKYIFAIVFFSTSGLVTVYAQNSIINFANTFLKINENYTEVINRLDDNFYSVDTVIYNDGKGNVTITETGTNQIIASISFEDDKVIGLSKIWGYKKGEESLNIFNDLFNILNNKPKADKINIELTSDYEPNRSNKTIRITVNQFEAILIDIFDSNIQLTEYFSNGKIHYEK